MKVGDLVMWLGTDSDHGMMGIIVEIVSPLMNIENRTTFDVQWSDGTLGLELFDEELMAVSNDPER